MEIIFWITFFLIMAVGIGFFVAVFYGVIAAQLDKAYNERVRNEQKWYFNNRTRIREEYPKKLLEEIRKCNRARKNTNNECEVYDN